MKPQSLEEFAQWLRVTGDFREAEFADEILTLLDLETEVAEPYSDLCADLETYAPDHLKNATNEHARTAEWLNDRSNMLADIEKALEEAGREPEGINDTADAVQELLDTLGKAEEGSWPRTSWKRRKTIPRRCKPMEYDL